MNTEEETALWTFADFLAWEGRGNIEIIHGEPVRLETPIRVHQEISRELMRQFAGYLEGKRGRVYSAPFSVRPFARRTDRPEDISDVLEPDLTVVCDEAKLDRYGCCGAPDLVVEILSPATENNDRVRKKDMYQRAGVKEYWLVSPREQTVEVFLLAEGVYREQRTYGAEESILVSVLENLTVDLKPVFRWPL